MTDEFLSVSDELDPNGMFALFERWERKGLVSSADACKQKYTEAKREIQLDRERAEKRRQQRKSEDAAHAGKQSAAPSPPSTHS